MKFLILITFQPPTFTTFLMLMLRTEANLLKENWNYSEGLFPTSADIANVKTVVVAVRRESDGYTYKVNNNRNNTRDIYRKKGDLYFFNLETKEYFLIPEVVAGNLPNKKGGGKTSFNRYKLLGIIKGYC